MKKILVLSGENFIGKLIMNGFARGFALNKCRVMEKAINELSFEDVQNFKPDMVFGYDYSFLTNKNCENIILSSECKNFVFYFADEPQSEFAIGENKNLYEELKKIDAKIFIWDKDFKKEFKNCTYLPPAINPAKYIIDFSGYKYAITFIGNPSIGKNEKLLCQIVKAYSNKLNIFCKEENFTKSIETIKEKGFLDEDSLAIYSKCWRGQIEKEEDLAKIYNSTKVNINANLQGKSSINFSTFSVLAAGGFLLTDEREDLKKHFEISKHLETYKNYDDLIDKIDFYLNNLNIAQKIAQLGRFEVIENNTFSARASIILKETIAA